jgi:hypothetical protein
MGPGPSTSLAFSQGMVKAASCAMGATGQWACLDAPMLHRRSSSFGVESSNPLASRERRGRDGRKGARSEEERRSAGLQAANCGEWRGLLRMGGQPTVDSPLQIALALALRFLKEPHAPLAGWWRWRIPPSPLLDALLWRRGALSEARSQTR